MGAGGVILANYLAALCCLFSILGVAGALFFIGRRKKDQSRARALEVRDPKTPDGEAPEMPSSDAAFDPPADND